MNIAYNKENVLLKVMPKSKLIYLTKIFHQKLLDLKEVFSCKIQAILVNYVKFMKLEASKSSTFNFLESIYNINNNLILRKRPTDPFILDCKLLLRLKKKIRSLKLHPKPK